MRRDSRASSQAKQACPVLRDGRRGGLGWVGLGRVGVGGGDQDTDPCSHCGGMVTRPGW